MIKPIPYGKQFISEDDINAVVEVLRSDFLTQGPAIAEFEKKFAEYAGCHYAVAVANGTAALHLGAIALGVDTSSNVITTPITFAASANCIRYCNGNVYFADIDPDTFLLDLEKVEELIDSKPMGFFNGIIPVDFAGYPVNMEKLKSIADKHGLWIMEDACHAPGAYFTDSKGKKQYCGNGAHADISVFSFHPVKHIACGEGGMITTNDKALYEKMTILRTHGITKEQSLLAENHGGWYYEMQSLGYNYRLTDFQAALGTSQLREADKRLEKRRAIAKRYHEAFEEHPNILKHSGYNEQHAYHLYLILVKDRLQLYNRLREKNIFSQVHYIPIHTFPYYQKLGWKKGDFPVAEKYYEHCLSLPMYPFLGNEEQEYVIDVILDFLH